MNKDTKVKLVKKLEFDYEKMDLYASEGSNPCRGQCGCSANYDDYDDGYCHCGGACVCGCGGCN